MPRADHHELKCHPDPFLAVLEQTKTHEVRVFDRDFKVGDTVRLREFNPETATYTGRQLLTRITYVSPPGSWGLPSTIGVFSFVIHRPGTRP